MVEVPALRATLPPPAVAFMTPPPRLRVALLSTLAPAPEISESAIRVRLSKVPVVPILALRLMLLPAVSVNVVSTAPVLVIALLTVMSLVAASVTSVVLSKLANCVAVIRLLAPLWSVV